MVRHSHNQASTFISAAPPPCPSLTVSTAYPSPPYPSLQSSVSPPVSTISEAPAETSCKTTQFWQLLKLLLIEATFIFKAMNPTGLSLSARRAYVTFLAGAGDYIKGAIGLAKGLRKVKSAYPLVVAVLDDVPEDHRQLLRMQACLVRQIEPIRPEGIDQCNFSMAHYAINYSKLRIWLFEEFEKIVYLDADIIVYDNIDHLFDLPNGRFYGVMDCFCEHTWSHSLQFKVKYCQQCPDRNPWPKHLGEPPAKYFNAGMFVHEPSKKTFDQLMVALGSSHLTPFAEQDLLNMFFQKIFSPIPLLYNLVMAMLWRHPEKVELEKVKVVHYCATGSKPWRFTGNEEHMDREDIKMLVQKWWSIYNDKALDYSPAHVGQDEHEDLHRIAPEVSAACIPLLEELCI